MKKLLVLLAAWGCVCLLSTKDRIPLSQQEGTVTAASDTLEVLTYRPSLREGLQRTNSTDNMLFISSR
jgi:hypothetical protein